jgi:predicted Zn-ribbon and HTH transcriptional regulator
MLVGRAPWVKPVTAPLSRARRACERKGVYRKDLLTLLSAQPRSVSSVARELGLKRGDVEDDLRHLLRSARAAGHRVVVEPARCRACGFTFHDDKLAKPGKCPECRATWLHEAQISVEPAT